MLTGAAIAHYREAGAIVIEPFISSQLGPNSYDLTLASTMLIHSQRGVLDMKRKPKTWKFEIGDSGYVLQPGVVYLGLTNEVCGTREGFVPCIEGRSSVARLGISVHLTAGFGDVGFVNRWTLEITVVEPVRIYAGVRICQAYFEPLTQHLTDVSCVRYHGKYKRLTTLPQASRLYQDFTSGEPQTKKVTRKKRAST